jgi:membrane protease YdiL (CAAX protease family)
VALKINPLSTNAQKEKEPQKATTLLLRGQNNLKPLHSLHYRLLLFVGFLVFGLSLPALSGLLVFPFSLIPNSLWQIYSISLSIFFLTLTILFHRNEQHKKYWQILLAFFIASFALNLQAISGWLGFQTTTMNGIVLAMLSSTALVVTSIIVLTKLSGGNMYSIFVSRGKIKLGLIVGLAGFLVFAALSIPGAIYLFQGQNLTITKLVFWMPWILPIVLANGLREELLYRGLFLRKFEGLLGNGLSVFLQALIFSLSHSVAGIGLTQDQFYYTQEPTYLSSSEFSQISNRNPDVN